MSTKMEATVEDLYGVEGKAEIVNGEIMFMSPTGRRPMYAARAVFLTLYEYEKATKRGYAVTDGAGFSVVLPNRKSFSPDAAFYVGDLNSMTFFDGAPKFAVEVRSENDYGAKAEQKIAAKRADYFTAGTHVVWDIDLLGSDVVRAYRADDPTRAQVFRRGELADAEPALPDWTMPVGDLFIESDE